MEKYLEYKDESVHLYWQIEVKGCSYTVYFGKMQSAGQVRVRKFSSAEYALRDARWQVDSMLGKGYVEKTAPFDREGAARLSLTIKERDKGNKLVELLKAFIKQKKTAELTELTIGCWNHECAGDLEETINCLIEHKTAFPALKSIFIGDINREEQEREWINLCNLGPLLKAFPQLEGLKIQGGPGLRLSNMSHEQLKRLTIVSGGLNRKTIEDITAATLPALERLELYLGSQSYGFNGDLWDLAPFMMKGRFPALTYLGLLNSEISDEIAEAIVQSDILEQLEVLDLSQGTISDRGAAALLKCEAVKKLRHLNLSHNYMSEQMLQKLEQLGISVNISDAAGDDCTPEKMGWDHRCPGITWRLDLYPESVE